MNETTTTTDVTNVLQRPTLTTCALCSRALNDAASVQIGVGPDCRKKIDYDKVPEALRTRVNELLAQISLHVEDQQACLVYADQIRELGLDNIAQAIVRRFCEVRLALCESSILLFAPFRSDVNAAYKREGGRWCQMSRAWRFDKAAEARVR